MKSKLIVVVLMISMALLGCGNKTEAENKNIVTEEKGDYDIPQSGKDVAGEINADNAESDTNEMNVEPGTSSAYTEKQLADAKNVIINAFNENFKQCTLQKIEYDEAYSISMEKMNKEMYQVESAVVFTSTFVVDEDYVSGPLNAGAVYEGYEWIMTMDAEENWKVISCGYQ